MNAASSIDIAVQTILHLLGRHQHLALAANHVGRPNATTDFIKCCKSLQDTPQGVVVLANCTNAALDFSSRCSVVREAEEPARGCGELEAASLHSQTFRPQIVCHRSCDL